MSTVSNLIFVTLDTVYEEHAILTDAEKVL